MMPSVSVRGAYWGFLFSFPKPQNNTKPTLDLISNYTTKILVIYIHLYTFAYLCILWYNFAYLCIHWYTFCILEKEYNIKSIQNYFDVWRFSQINIQANISDIIVANNASALFSVWSLFYEASSRLFFSFFRLFVKIDCHTVGVVDFSLAIIGLLKYSFDTMQCIIRCICVFLYYTFVLKDCIS